jgi:transcriptional regulator NrdR family protein
MTCPNCGSDNTCVRETMHGTGGKVYRRRRCNDCRSLFRTVEDLLDDTEQSNKDYFEAVKNKSALLRSIYD